MMKKISVILLICFSFILISSCRSKAPAQIKNISRKTVGDDPARALQNPLKGRAVSLRVLQKSVEDCMVNGHCPENILQLSGVKKISGYIIDKENKDIILIGKVDETSPPLYLDDFVIALRNAWMKYAELKGNSYYYSNPGCSIDPDTRVVNDLQQIANQIFSSSDPEIIQKNLDQWQNVCRQPQWVRVIGIPFNTRFGKVMVEADYYMKRLVDGSVKLDIEGFTSLTDMTLNMVKEDLDKGRPISINLCSINRFWFSPGENSYLENKGVALIKRSQVKLLTEEEFLTERGEVAGRGGPDPLADKFAKSFSTKYPEIAKREPIYAELEGLFRFVSLAKLMKFKKAHSEAGISLDYLIDQYFIESTPVSPTLPGISNIEEFKNITETQEGYIEFYLWLPSCGGVAIDINIKETDIESDKTESLLEIKSSVLSSRPSPDSCSWDFPEEWVQ